jgi:nicotinate dehydrogenase subunit A
LTEEITLRVNGRLHTVRVEAETPLLYVLRNDLGLKGAKLGCGLEQCGSCTVIVGSEAALSCGLPVGKVGEREVTTLEGLAENGRLHPLQQAFIDERAAQCGYCVPGAIMEAAALLAWNSDPSETDIRRTLSIHLCRCGAHNRMVKAVQRAARETRG